MSRMEYINNKKEWREGVVLGSLIATSKLLMNCEILGYAWYYET